MSEEIFDVILQTTGHFHTDVRTFQDHRPPRQFVLSDDVWVGHLPNDLKSTIVLDACDPAGFNFRPARQYEMHYAFCRRVVPDHENYYKWDSDLKIGTLIFLSRLIRPTTIAHCYSARLYFEDTELKTIVAGPTHGLGAHAWVVAKDNWRDWLSVGELEQLRDLSGHYHVSVPDRVRRSRRHIGHAFHTYYLDQRFASIVTSFESLLKVSSYQSTKQFATRAPKLADMVGFELTGAEAEVTYRDRSAFVHGAEVGFNELSEDLIEQYDKFERVIRRALLRASTEPDFAQLFHSTDSIERSFGR